MLNNEEILKIPQSIEAERNILGSMLLDIKTIDIANGYIKSPDFFYVPSHQEVYKSILSINRNNGVVDIVTVMESLDSKGILDDVGGWGLLSDLQESVVSLANIETYLKIALDSYQRREIIKICNGLIKDAYNTKDVTTDKLIERAENSFIELAEKRNAQGLTHISQVLETRVQMYKSSDPVKKSFFIPSGFPNLDDTLKIEKSNLIIIAARPAMGKTAFALQLGYNIAKDANVGPVAIFSLEMDKEALTDRIVSTNTGINTYKLKTGNMSDKELKTLDDIQTKISNSDIYLDDGTSSTVSEIFSKCRMLKMQHKNLGAVIIDYLQLLDNDQDNLNRNQEISKISRSLKKMALILKVPVIALSQLSRKVEERQNKRPQLSDLRESGAIEQDADTVMFIYRDEYYNKDSTNTMTAEINVAKQRHAGVGVTNMFFDSEITKFDDLIKT